MKGDIMAKAAKKKKKKQRQIISRGAGRRLANEIMAKRGMAARAASAAAMLNENIV